MKHLKILFAIAVLVLALTPVGAQDVTTVTTWLGEGSTLECWGTIMLEFNEVDPSVQLEIVTQANTWDVTRTAVAGGGGTGHRPYAGSLFRLRNGSGGLDSAHGRLRR